MIADVGTIDWRFEPATGEWTSLWDGRTFAGWDHAGSGGFQRVIDDGAPALQAQGSGGILWYNAREFADYELEVSYEHNGVGDNGGIFLRFPNPGENRAVADQGYQVAILDRVDDVAQRTGSVLGCAAAQKLNAKPVGEGYNRFRIRFVGTRIEVYLNEDAQANADPVAVCDNADRADQGFVGIENAGASIRYKDIRIRELRAGVQRPLVRVSATPQSGLAPLEVAFRADATDPEGQGITYAWEFGDGDTGTGQTATHTLRAGRLLPGAGDRHRRQGRRELGADRDRGRRPRASACATESGYCVVRPHRPLQHRRHLRGGRLRRRQLRRRRLGVRGRHDAARRARDLPRRAVRVPVVRPRPEEHGRGARPDAAAGARARTRRSGCWPPPTTAARARTATINYADGSTQTVPLRLTDWAQSPGVRRADRDRGDHRHDQDSDTGAAGEHLHPDARGSIREREIKSITLPERGAGSTCSRCR